MIDRFFFQSKIKDMKTFENFKYFELWGDYFSNSGKIKNGQFVWIKVHESLTDNVYYDNVRYRKFELLANVFYDFFIEDYTIITKEEFMYEHTYTEEEYQCDSSIIFYGGANMDYDTLYAEYLKKWYFYRKYYFDRLMYKARQDSKYYKYLVDEKKELNKLKMLIDKYGI